MTGKWVILHTISSLPIIMFDSMYCRYFGAALRLEGKELLRKGGELEDDRRTLEAEAAVKIHKIDMDLQEYLKTREEELERERKLFGTKLAQQRDRIALDIELRKQELEKLKAERKKEFQAVGKLSCLSVYTHT